jgi:hypothetical protein
MDRRTFLSTVGSGLAVAVAGCTESGDGAGTDDGSDPGANGTDGGPGTDETTAAPTTTDAPGTTDGTDDGTTTDTATDDPSTEQPTDDGTATGDLAVADTAFEVTSNRCGGASEEATVTVDGETVTVDGLIRGSDGCHTARLAGTSVDGGTLTVGVESYVPESEADEVCQQCLVDIEYTASVTTTGGPPDSVVVEHGDERVTTADATER